MPRISRTQLVRALELLYRARNRRMYVDPDPLFCLYRYRDPADLEIAGLVAAGLAYGRVAQIMRNTNAVFDALGPQPRAWLERTSPSAIRRSFRTFQHRWTTGEELSTLLVGVQRTIYEHGSLERALARHQSPSDATVVPALTAFCSELRNGQANSLLPDPAKQAACKRLHLYLRWMVRADDVDFGCWTTVSPALLVVPLDTHMHRIARSLGLTRRKQANLVTALEVTRAFRRMQPSDPVRYDFVLTRFGIRPELSLSELQSELRAPQSDYTIAPAS